MKAGPETLWTNTELGKLRRMLADGVSVRLIADRLGRTQIAVQQAIERLRDGG